MIMAHEFAHHVQFELGVFDTGPTDPAEATRRTELMADAMAAYFGVHKKGLALNKKRVIDALLSFYTVGDCEFADPGHHGTPLQRGAPRLGRRPGRRCPAAELRAAGRDLGGPVRRCAAGDHLRRAEPVRLGPTPAPPRLTVSRGGALRVSSAST